MRLCNASLVVALLAGSGLAGANGDVLQMPPASAPPAAEGTTVDMVLPVRGMNMQQVETRFGAPLQKVAAVGEPPISRWMYADYTVYFEHRYVIHTVLKTR